MSDLPRLAKQDGRNHTLALAFWVTGDYEARTVAALVAEPGCLPPVLMDRWRRDFDYWAICGTVCFKWFYRSAQSRDSLLSLPLGCPECR